MYGPYTMRRTSTQGDGNYALGVPPALGQKLYGRQFQLEVTAKGLLFKPVEQTEEESLPAWIEGGEAK